MIGWMNARPIDGDCFRIYKLRSSYIPLSYFLGKIDLNKYFIYKASENFRQIQKEEIGKYSKYIFFNKELYKKEEIDKWIEEIKFLKISIKFLDKPFPRIGVTDKIELI